MVILVVLAQNAHPWKVSTHFEDLVDVPPEWAEDLLPMVPKFTYRLVQLAEMPFEKIEGTPLGVLALRALKAERRGELLRSEVWDEALFAQLPRNALEQLFFYIYSCGNFDNESFERKVREVNSPEIRTTAMTFAQRLRLEGQVLTGQQAVLEVLEVRFGDVPSGLREEIVAIDDTARLSHLLRAAIRCADLEVFTREL